MKTWFITGANRGLGLEMVKAGLANGDNVVGTARNTGSLINAIAESDHFLAVSLDVSDKDQISTAVLAAKERFGAIDILVNNAGYGQYGWFETVSDEQIRSQFDTNVHGVMNVTREVLPIMREQKSGHIFSVTSTAGIVGSPGFSAYCASKFAVEGWMQALALEVNPLHIKTTIIEPGPFKTDFLDDSSLKSGALEIPDYAEVIEASKAKFADANHKQVGDPEKLAQAVVTLTQMDRPPLHFPAGKSAVDTLLRKADELQADVAANRQLSLGTDA